MGEKVGFTFIGFSHIRQYAGTPFRHHIVTPSSCILPVKGAISATVVPLTINCLASMGALMKKKVFDKKHFHFKAKQGAYVALFPSTEVWEIENISLKGLSFWYIPRGEPPEDPTQIDIFVNDETFYLKCVQCKIVSDFPSESG